MGIFDGDFGFDDLVNLGTGGMYGVAKGGYDYLSGEGDSGDALNLATGGQAGQVGSASDLGAEAVGSGPELSFGGVSSASGGGGGAGEMDAQAKLLMEMQRAALEYQKYRPEVRQARMNAMRQRSQAYQPANNALQTLYGESFNPGTMFDDPFGPSVDTPSGMPLPPEQPQVQPQPATPPPQGIHPGPRMPPGGGPPVMAPPQMGPRNPRDIFV